MEITEIREKVLKALELEGHTEFSDEDLSKMLKKKRKKYHSDKTQDEDFKTEFNDKFIEFNNLLKEFTVAKINETENTTAIALVSDNLDYYQTKKENLELEEALSDLQTDNENKKKVIESLENSIKIVSRESILQERAALISSIKPKRKDYLTPLGIIGGLTLGLNALTKLENISTILRESFRVNANYILLTLFVIICLLFIYNLIKEMIVKNISLEVCSANVIREFAKSYHYYYTSFSETDVFDFIKKLYESKKGVLNWIKKNIFKVYDNSTIEIYKQIFIFDLLSKKLIRIGEVNTLEQKYLIIKQIVEKTKNGEVYLKEI